MPREYCNESKPDNYVICRSNSNLCILNKFLVIKLPSEESILMKTKKHLSDLGINHTGKKKKVELWYQPSIIWLPPNSHNAKQGQKRQRFKPSTLTTLGKEDKYATIKFKYKLNLFMVIETKTVVTFGGGIGNFFHIENVYCLYLRSRVCMLLWKISLRCSHKMCALHCM